MSKTIEYDNFDDWHMLESGDDYISFGGLGAGVGKSISSSLKDNTTKTLSFAECDFSDAVDLANITESIHEHKHLYKLWFTDCQIDDKGAEHIAEMIRCNSSLTELILWNNKFGDEGIQMIKEAAEKNDKLEKFEL